jgi:iduronate 2-sulfatase
VPDEVQGVSLVPVLRDHQASVKNGALSFNKGYSLRTDDWHYMRYSDATVELYDMNSDRNEFTNLASDDDYASVVKELDAALNRRLGAAKIKE